MSLGGLVRRVASRVVGVVIHEPETPLRQGSSKVSKAAHERYLVMKVARQEATGEAARSITLVSFFLTMLSLAVLTIFFVMEFASFDVLRRTHGFRCDAHLYQWLLMRSLMTWGAVFISQSSNIVRFVWLFVGSSFLTHVHTCIDTDPALVAWVRFLIKFDLAWIFTIVMLNFGMVFSLRTFQGLVESGMLKNPKAARSDTAKMLESVDFCKDSYRLTDDLTDKRPPDVCICCQQKFEVNIPMVVTPCKHHFHADCMDRWLRLASWCPECRCDVDYAVHASA